MSEQDVAAFEQRIVDNTLPQAAYHYLTTRHGDRLDPTALVCFDTFIDAYVNTPVRCITLPEKNVGVGDRFIQLWLDSPDKVIATASPSAEAVGGEDRELEAFAAALNASPNEWAGFLCFQFTPQIATQYKSRVVDWRDRLDRAMETIRTVSSALSPNRDRRISNFSDQVLEPALGRQKSGAIAYRIDPEYLGWTRARGMELVNFAIAYGYDWYKRGLSYSRFGRGRWVGFHPLRSDAAADIGNATTQEVQGIEEVRWSHIVRAYMDRGILPSDPLVVSELLVTLRHGVQYDAGIDFARRVSEAALADIGQRDQLRRYVIIDVLTRSGVNPILRSHAQRSESMEDTAKIVESVANLGLHGANLAAPLLGGVVRYGLKSRPLVRAEFRLRRRMRSKSLWRVFEVPGLTTDS